MNNTLTGTWSLVRLMLRRDRIRLPIWILAILGVSYASAEAVQGIYNTQTDLDNYANTMGNSPAAIAMSGPPTALNTVGGVTIFEINMTVMVATALMAIFLVVRHTRGEEEAGRTELLRSTVVGRHAQTAAALLVVGGAVVVVGAGVAGELLALGLPAGGSTVYGASVAALGLVFTAAGACAAQVMTNARGALGLSAAVLGLSFALRAAGDVGNAALTWISPMGWSQVVRSYADNRWWPLLISLGATIAVLTLAAVLTAHRDVGAGLAQPRPGPSAASPRLGSAIGLAARLQRGTVIGWSVGLLLGGIAFGSVGREVTEMVENEPTIAEALTAAGGADIVESFLGTAAMLLALIAVGFTVSSVLRMRTEEAAGRVEPLLATGLSRTRWVLAGLLTAGVGTVIVIGAGGLGMGLAHGLSTDDMWEVPRLTVASLAYVPAALVLAGVAMLLLGWLPRASMAVWAAVAGCFLVGWLGAVLDLPEVIMELSPYTHVPQAPAETLTAAPLVALAAVAVAAAGVGLAGLRRRDIG